MHPTDVEARVTDIQEVHVTTGMVSASRPEHVPGDQASRKQTTARNGVNSVTAPHCLYGTAVD